MVKCCICFNKKSQGAGKKCNICIKTVICYKCLINCNEYKQLCTCRYLKLCPICRTKCMGVDCEKITKPHKEFMDLLGPCY